MGGEREREKDQGQEDELSRGEGCSLFSTGSREQDTHRHSDDLEAMAVTTRLIFAAELRTAHVPATENNDQTRQFP